MNSGFGKYLKEYLEFNNISQTEFATRLNITQKHMNEILNNKADITLEMAANIEKLTGISATFIIKAEYRKYTTKYLLGKFENEENIKKYVNDELHLKELQKRNWVEFNDITNIYQDYIDIIKFLQVRDLEALEKVRAKTLFKKSGDDANKINLWIARANLLASEQNVKEYVKENFYFLIEDLRNMAYETEGIDIDKVQKLLNQYGIYFVVEKALSGTKIRGCFRVKGKNPAIYVTQNYAGKDSFYFEVFHELGHCKSDYNEAQNKVIVEGTELQENRADKFALNAMIKPETWNEIEKDYSEENLIKISKENKIPMSFIVGRLAKLKLIKYNSDLYKKYYTK